jgi:hypothetical protein
VSTIGVLAVAVDTVTTPVFFLALVAWAVAGVGVGLAYPALYVRSTTGGDAAELAAAVITAEAFGGLLGRAVGGAVSSVSGPAGLGTAYFLFATALATAVLAAARVRCAAGRPPRRVRSLRAHLPA